MDNVRLVQITQGHENLARDDRHILLLEDAVHAGLHEGAYASTLSILHDNPDPGAIKITTIVLRDIGGIAELCEQGYFALYVADIVILCVEIDNF